MRIHYSIFLFLFLSGIMLLPCCAFKRINRIKNITYLQADTIKKIASQELDMYAPRKAGDASHVFIFIHGGNWNSGNKSLYGFLGSRMARKGVLAVIIEYPLSPEAQYNQMASAAATSVKWVYEHIREYGGDPEKIFVSGHSAGGHLAALLSVRQEYFDSLGIKSPIKGAILIDAAGLDMYGYLKEQQFNESHTYLKTFTPSENIWKQASPLYHLRTGMPPLLIFMGENTYDSITKSTGKFVQALKARQATFDYQVIKGKKHRAMITQFLWSKNPLYRKIISFMR